MYFGTILKTVAENETILWLGEMPTNGVHVKKY